jgi:hypothetical protein
MRANLASIDKILEFYFEAVSKCLFAPGCLFDVSKLPARRSHSVVTRKTPGSPEADAGCDDPTSSKKPRRN